MLGLAVGAQVLVAEAARDLVVAVGPRDHEDLLEELRRLRQGVETVRLQAHRDEEVARALGRRLGQHRRLDLEEALLVEVGARRLHDVVAQDQVGEHRRAPQVEVAVLQAQRLVDLAALRGLDLEGRRLRLVQHLELGDADLDLAGRQLRVHRLGATRDDGAARREDELGADRLGQRVRRRGRGRIDDELHDAAAVAQVDEDQLAVVAPVRDPAGELDLATDVVAAQLAGIAVAQAHASASSAAARGARRRVPTARRRARRPARPLPRRRRAP